MQSGRRFLITAAASGIGLAIARAFAAEGAKVRICDVDEDALSAATRAELSITSTVCDVSDLPSVERLVEVATSQRVGRRRCAFVEDEGRLHDRRRTGSILRPELGSHANGPYT